MRYCIGVDGGGTKTAICAADADGHSLLRVNIGGTSWREYGADNVAKNLKDAISGLTGGGCGKIDGMAMGLPCYGESVKGDRGLEAALRKAFADIPIYFANDTEVGWAGSFALQPGINVVAGTGAIAFGKDGHGASARCGGWSEFFGDEGSCYWIGRALMEMFSKQADGRLPKDELYDTVKAEFGLADDLEFIDIMHAGYVPYRDRVAGLQMTANKAALAGSACAREIYRRAAAELGMLVRAVKGRLDFSGKPCAVSYSGGLFKGGAALPLFKKEVEEAGGCLAPPLFEPVDGALLMAYSRFRPGGLSAARAMIMEGKE